MACLGADRLGHGGGAAALQQRLGQRDRLWRQRRQRPGLLERGRQRAAFVGDAVDQAGVLRDLGPEGLAQHQQFGGALAAGDQWQEIARAAFRAEAEADEGHAETGAASGESEIAMQQHGGADADGEAFRRSDNRLLGRRDRGQEVDGDLGADAGRGSRGKILDVVAAGEAAAGASEHDGAHRGVGISGGKRVDQPLIGGAVERIAPIGPVHGDLPDALGRGLAQNGLGHANLLECPSRRKRAADDGGAACAGQGSP